MQEVHARLHDVAAQDLRSVLEGETEGVLGRAVGEGQHYWPSPSSTRLTKGVSAKGRRCNIAAVHSSELRS